MIFDCFKQDLLWQKISLCNHTFLDRYGRRYGYRYQFGIVLLFASKSNVCMLFTAADILFHIFTSTLSIILVPVVVLRRILVYRRR